MNKTLCLLFGFTVSLFSSCIIINEEPGEKYITLPSEGKTYNIKPFKALEADGVFDLVLLQGSKESVLVKGSLPQGLSICNTGETLVITDTLNIHGSHHSVKTTLYVTMVNVNTLSVETVGETSCQDTLKFKRLDFHSSGVGETTLWLNSDSVNINESGTGKLIIEGKSVYANIDASGVGSINAKEFNTDILHADVSGVGAAEVYASKEIYISASGVGGVEYYGPAKVMKSESSGIGKVEHVD